MRNDLHMTTPAMSWRNRVQHVGVVVRPVVVSRIAVALVDSITRIADAKPAPSGQERGVC